MDATKAALVGTGVAAFGIVSAFIGGLINQRMSRSAQREQWVLDNKKQEYRELLSILTRSYGTIIRLQAPGTAISGDQERELDQAHLDALAVIRDRLFIPRTPTLLTILKLWQDGTQRYQNDGDFRLFSGYL